MNASASTSHNLLKDDREARASLGLIANSTHLLRQNMGAVVNTSKRMQIGFQGDLERVAKLGATGEHKQWIATNADAAAMVL